MRFSLPLVWNQDPERLSHVASDAELEPPQASLVQAEVLQYKGVAGEQRKPACREKWENDRTGMTAGNPRGTEGGAVTFLILPQTALSLAVMRFPGYLLFSLAQYQFLLIC